MISVVAEVCAGSESALGALYDATSSRIFGLAMRILKDRGAAEEATLDVYTQVWRQAKRYKSDKGSVTAWLLTLARSRSIDLLRSRSSRGDRTEDFKTVFTMPDMTPGPEEASLGAERARRVRKALEALPTEQRQAIEAAYFGGLSHSEVAEALGQPLGTVKTRIRAGLATLRAALGPVQEEFE